MVTKWSRPRDLFFNYLILLCFFEIGGGGEIRTHGTRKGSLVFKTSALNHSATPPLEEKMRIHKLVILG